MKQLLLHKRTHDQVGQFIARPSHALLLVGSSGIGKTYVARYIIEAVLQLGDGTLSKYPYFSTITGDKGSISIDVIRDLRRAMQLKTIGDRPFRRAVLIEHAETLTPEAQNAYLKLLEEPPADTVMILTTASRRTLLPTILSRVQVVTVYVPDEQDVKRFFATLGKDTLAIEQAYFLSGGMLGLMTALLSGSEEHPLLSGVTAAKEILQKKLFERLVMVEGMSKQKDEAKCTLEALQHIAQTGIQQAVKKDDAAKLKQWHRILKASTEATHALNNSANIKLVLSDLMLRI